MITWEDVQKVYPDVPLEELRSQWGDWGGGEDPEGRSLQGLTFEVIDSGAKSAWSNRDQRMYIMSAPSFWPFEQGEILIAFGVGSREPFGRGRKSSKWSVGSKGFETYDEAKAYSDAIKARPAEFYDDDSEYVTREYGPEVLTPEEIRSDAHDPFAALMRKMKQEANDA